MTIPQEFDGACVPRASSLTVPLAGPRVPLFGPQGAPGLPGAIELDDETFFGESLDDSSHQNMTSLKPLSESL